MISNDINKSRFPLLLPLLFDYMQRWFSNRKKTEKLFKSIRLRKIYLMVHPGWRSPETFYYLFLYWNINNKTFRLKGCAFNGENSIFDTRFLKFQIVLNLEPITIEDLLDKNTISIRNKTKSLFSRKSDQEKTKS